MSAHLYDVVLLTESRYAAAEAAPDDWYLQQILTEDRLLTEALQAHGLTVARKDWADPGFDWASAHLTVFRTTWDYFHRFAEFSAWLERAAPLTQLVNAPALIRWNIDKRYLLVLEARGVPITPTCLIQRGATASLAQWHEQCGWAEQETVLKPAISGGARHTYRIRPGQWAQYEAVFQQLIANEDMLLQPFQHTVLTQGEVSIMVIGGRYTHAVQKIAKPGDFRVQDDFGGTVYAYAPDTEAIALAERAVAACPELPLYARVDLVRTNAGHLAVMELELIEPELFLRFYPPAAAQMAEALVNLARVEMESRASRGGGRVEPAE